MSLISLDNAGAFFYILSPPGSLFLLALPLFRVCPVAAEFSTSKIVRVPKIVALAAAGVAELACKVRRAVSGCCVPRKRFQQ